VPTIRGEPLSSQGNTCKLNDLITLAVAAVFDVEAEVELSIRWNRGRVKDQLPTFSWSVRREVKSFTRVSIGRIES